jgi:hypothetical protein
MSACDYKDVFGKPNTGVHSYRLFNIAIVDVIMTIVVGIILSRIFHVNMYASIFCLFIAGIILHRVFCVKTTVDVLLFG